jgi:hypothetical protein
MPVYPDLGNLLNYGSQSASLREIHEVIAGK